MRNLIFFDTETTGNTEEDFLIQIAYKTEDPANDGASEKFVGFYKPAKKIPPEASAVHHITNKMLEGAPSFKESPDYKKIKDLFEDEGSIVVAHNAPFDLMIIKKEGIQPKNFICTLRVARELDSEGKIERYNLQYLRYLLEIEIEAVAHDAMGDVLVLEKLFERLLNKIISQIPTDGGKSLSKEEAIQKMIEISSHPSILRTFSFGKHNGKKIEEVLAADRGYLEWLLAQKLESEGMEEDWIYTLQHHLNK
jgi:DNA polymerase III epsilon subunit-like protein